MTEIRSYRRVFDLERRVYAVDGMRLNPSGVPVRGVIYAVVLAGVANVLAVVPIAGSLPGLLPWYLRDVAVPVLAAAVIAVVRVDGRTFHQAARAQLALACSPRRLTCLCRSSGVGVRWRPPEIVVLPDGSAPDVRALAYVGPGAVRVSAPLQARPDRRRGPRRSSLELVGAGGGAAARGRVIWIPRGGRLRCVPRTGGR